MGPQLLIDKSTLQSLSKEEALFLRLHYNMIWAPILFIEILGDIKKFGNDIEKSKKEVAHTATKILGGDSCFTASYRILLHANLLGHNIGMDYRPVLLGGQDIISKDGRKGVFFDEEPEHKVLRRWLAGNFLEAEKLLSDSWRKSTRAFDLISWKKAYSYKNLPKIKNFQDLIGFAEKIATDSSSQFGLLQWLLSETGFNKEIRNDIFTRWLDKKMPALKEFSPYAHYCLKVFVVFYIGIASGLIGTKPTNRVDLEYILYLPFCRVFASNDKFLKDFAPLFLDKNQDFIWGKDLKSDLVRISKHWESFTDKQKIQYRSKYDRYPPDFENSVTNQLWKKYMPPREHYKGNPEITPQREKEIKKELKPFMEAIDGFLKNRSK